MAEREKLFNRESLNQNFTGSFLFHIPSLCRETEAHITYHGFIQVMHLVTETESKPELSALDHTHRLY